MTGQTGGEREVLCHAGQDGECTWRACPQLIDYRGHCPLDISLTIWDEPDPDDVQRRDAFLLTPLGQQVRELAEQPTPSRPVPVARQADARGRVGCDCGAGLSSCAPGCGCDHCARLRPTGGQAAREAAVEAVARELGRHQGLRGPMDDDRPDVWQNRCECGWDDGDERPGWRDRYRLHIAVAVLSLPELTA